MAVDKVPFVQLAELPAAAATADGATNPSTPALDVRVSSFNGSTWDRIRSAASDALAATGLLAAGKMLFNGTTWDRARGNTDVTLLASAARTTSQTGDDQTNYNARGLQVVLDMTVVGTGSVTLTIQGKDVASGKYYTLLAGAAVTTNSTNVYKVFPGSTVTANVSANDVLPRTWRIITTANNANSATYSVGASVVL